MESALLEILSVRHQMSTRDNVFLASSAILSTAAYACKTAFAEPLIPTEIASLALLDTPYGHSTSASAYKVSIRIALPSMATPVPSALKDTT
jgi:hypothetical protein